LKLKAKLPVLSCVCACISLAATSVPDDLSKAFEQMKAGNCEAVPETLKPLLNTKNPYQEAAYRLLSDCYSRQKDNKKAADTLREGIKSTGGSPMLERSLGELLFHEDPGNAEAGDLLRKATESMQGDAESRHFYAEWAYLNNRGDVCVEQEKQALAISGLNDTALLQMYTLKALCEDKAEEVELAQRDFQESNFLNGKLGFDPATAFQYASFLIRHNEGEEAQSILDSILAKSPRFGPAHLERAKYLDRKGEHERAIAEAKQAVDGEGNDENGTRAAHVLLAKLYFAVGKTREADEQQQWVIEHAGPK
jgi:tetratricopeptide (TPR) repeat protein